MALLSACEREHSAPKPSAPPTTVGATSNTPAAASVPPATTELETAFRAAYGKPSPVTDQSAEDRITFKPADLVDVEPSADLVALVSIGENQVDCHACSGSLSVRYLKRTAAGFQPLGRDYQFAGNGFGAPPQWTVRRDLESDPVLAIEAGFTGQGCTSAGQDLVALTPAGAVLRAERVPVYSDNSGVYEAGDPRIVTLEGEIRPLVKDRRFEVVFHGTRLLRVVYDRNAETYATKDETPEGC